MLAARTRGTVLRDQNVIHAARIVHMDDAYVFSLAFILPTGIMSSGQAMPFIKCSTRPLRWVAMCLAIMCASAAAQPAADVAALEAAAQRGDVPALMTLAGI